VRPVQRSRGAVPRGRPLRTKEEFLKIIWDRLNKEVWDYGVHLEQFGFIGASRLPATVVEILNAKIKKDLQSLRKLLS
jgi:hypothetical protein